ncbi:MAG: hypothetical protein L0H31_11045, partial [Nocardioidaceae bacterium]|nr:hypothetical protein [Nocardioidaceae bacterium]
PGGWGGPPAGPPPRKRRWPLFLGLGLALVLVAGLGVSSWMYFTGRFGFGPLSSADKAAAKTITEGVDTPAWADEDQIKCSVDKLVGDERSKGLEESGVIKGEGDDWEYTKKWKADDAQAYFEGILDCSDDWAKQVGEEWNLEKTDCLKKVGTSTISGYFAHAELDPNNGDDDSLADTSDKAVDKLDECYAQDPPTPSATATPAYRGVKFKVSVPDDAPDDVTFSSNQDGGWTPISGSTVTIDTEEGGQKGCVSVQAKVTYGWGSSKEAEDKFCGKAKPKRVWWKKANKCRSKSIPNCQTWRLKMEGFSSYDFVTVRYTHNGGPCLAVSGSCTDSVLMNAEGRLEKDVTWSFPADYDGDFRAVVGKIRSKIPN